jgi:hypothetical protein
MSEPKRYRLDPESYLAEHPQGDFIDYQDYARLKAQVEQLTKAGDELGEWFMDIHPSKKKWNAAKEGKQP